MIGDPSLEKCYPPSELDVRLRDVIATQIIERQGTCVDLPGAGLLATQITVVIGFLCAAREAEFVSAIDAVVGNDSYRVRVMI